VLVEFRWEGQSRFDLSGIGLEELEEVLDRSNLSALELTVRQSKGLRKTVVLKKEKIETEENTVKGFVLNGIKKIGYLSLPGFYTRWGEDGSSSCANDVAAEIIKLKGENIDGVILDIRSNGGGSLKEAIDMAGIFIDEGPLVMMTDKIGRITTLKDVNRGTVYDGPLVILINGQSASASEILAAAIQDYHRGIVVGGASFGKATGQVVFSLDPDNHQPTTIQPNQSNAFGYATVTLDRLYRVAVRELLFKLLHQFSALLVVAKHLFVHHRFHEEDLGYIIRLFVLMFGEQIVKRFQLRSQLGFGLFAFFQFGLNLRDHILEFGRGLRGVRSGRAVICKQEGYDGQRGKKL